MSTPTNEASPSVASLTAIARTELDQLQNLYPVQATAIANVVAELAARLAAAEERGALAAQCHGSQSALRRVMEEHRQADERLRAVGELLEKNGCDCECDQSREEHEDDCERCLACRIEEVVASPAPEATMATALRPEGPSDV